MDNNINNNTNTNSQTIFFDDFINIKELDESTEKYRSTIGDELNDEHSQTDVEKMLYDLNEEINLEQENSEPHFSYISQNYNYNYDFNEYYSNIYDDFDINKQISQTIDYDLNYTLTQIKLICDYYNIKTTKKNKKDLINMLILFENEMENQEIVHKRKRLWYFMNELYLDKFMKNYVIWNMK